MAEFLATNKPPASWIGDCHVGHLKEDSNASAKMAADKDPPPWLKHGVPTFVEGTMSCTKVGKSANVKIMVVLSDDKVAMFGLDRVQ